MASMVNSDVGIVFGFRGTWLGQEDNNGALYTGVLNFGGYCWGVCILTGGYRCIAAVHALCTTDETLKAEQVETMGGGSKVFLFTQICRGVGEIFHLTLLLVFVDVIVTLIRFNQTREPALQHHHNNE